jgi:DNA recombination-dependent growth factor C
MLENEHVGLFNGSITYRRFRVVGDIPDNFRQVFLDAVKGRAHEEIRPEGEDEKALGWVCAGDLLDHDYTLEKLFVGDTLVLTFRIDTLRVPSSALGLYMKQAEREFKVAMGREKLSKRDREEIKDRMMKTLRKRVIPQVKGIDLAWSVTEGVLRLWTHNKTVTDDFLGLFQDTFGLRAIPRTPYTAISEVGLPEELLERAVTLEAADFTVPPDESARATGGGA